MCTDLVVAGMYAIHFGNTYYKAILVLALLTDRPKVGMLFCANMPHQVCKYPYYANPWRAHGMKLGQIAKKCQKLDFKIRQINLSY